MSEANSLPDRITQFDHALTAAELSKLLAISKVTIFKHAAAGRIPSFHIGSCVRAIRSAGHCELVAQDVAIGGTLKCWDQAEASSTVRSAADLFWTVASG